MGKRLYKCPHCSGTALVKEDPKEAHCLRCMRKFEAEEDLGPLFTGKNIKGDDRG